MREACEYMAFSSDKMSFVLIPLMAPGHTIPMVDLAKLLARRGAKTTILLTSLNAARYKTVIDRAIQSGLPIQLLHLRFPTEEAGLPEGCESLDVLPSFTLARNFFTAISMLQEPAEKILGELTPKPYCIISDKHIHWTAETADKFKIPRIVFDGMSCFTQVCFHNLHKLQACDGIPETAPFLIPDMPDTIEVTRSQLPGAFNPASMDHLEDVRELIRASEAKAHGFVINSYEELENKYVEEFKKVKGGRVWCVGPLSLCNDDVLDRAERGNAASGGDAGETCLKWLDSWPAGSVIYACLGSLSRVTVAQFIELALGLESSNYPFILVVKPGDTQSQVERWISENGLEKRVKERSLLIRGWAPQVLILSHPSVGGFLTHCGWNSTLEGITAGVPLITWPLFAEQFLNEKLAVSVLRIAASVGPEAVVHLGEEDRSEKRVGRESVRSGIQRAMEEGQDGYNGMRERAREAGERAKKAVRLGGSSHLNLTLLIQEIMHV